MKKNRKRWLLAIILCIIALCSVNGIWAYFTDETEVRNEIHTGIIKIHMDEYEKDEDGKEIPYKNPKEVLPGDQVSKILRITNEEQDAYIRAKVEIVFEDKALQGSLTAENLVGVDEERWIYKNGYFYCRELVKSKGTVDLFQGIKIPESWDNSYANSKFSIDIMAEAVQSANFKPDYSQDQPWGDIEIEACAYPEP